MADDAELLRRAREGDTRALSALYGQYCRVVFARAFLETGSRADAEELMQDVFLLLWKKRRKIQFAGTSALPWLLVCTRHLSANRRRYNHRRATETLPTDLQTGAGSEPEARAVRAQFMASIDASVARLDPTDQEILRLCAVEGLSYREAADALGISHGAVRNRLGRARAVLRTDAAAYTEGGR